MSSEQSVRLIIDGMPGLISTATAAGATESVNQQLLEYFGKTLESLNSWTVSDAVHPQDRPQTMANWRHSLETGYPYDVEHRLCDANGTYRWFHVRGLPARDGEGRIIRWNILLTDIEDRKQAEEKLRRNETDLMEARRLASELQHERDRLRLLLDLNNRVASDLDLRQVFQAISSELRRIFKCDFVGLARPDSTDKQLRQHMIDFPESKGLMKEGALYPIEGSLSGAVFRSAKALVLNSLAEGTSIWSSDPAFYGRVTEEGPFQSGCFLPLVSGNRVLGVLQLTSRDERSFAEHDVEFLSQIANQIAISLKNALQYEQVNKTKDRLHDENMALREQIDGACMFEEIVGSSPPLQRVLTSVVKVGPTDSTVLILGETGTGKELIARAAHKCSRRSGRAFISMNCASIPSSLIASELFGHEKGAFTGALQQRQGRFEQAHSGTIFLDEIGDLPAETTSDPMRFQTISLLTLPLAATATPVARFAAFTLALVLMAGCRRHAPTPAGEVFRSFDRVLLLEEKGETSAGVNVGDLNGDGFPDIVLGKGRHWPLYNRVLLNDGKRGFSATNLGTAPDRTYSAALADIDRDGDLDIIVSNDAPDRKLVYLNDGKGHFTEGGTFGRPKWTTRYVTLADLNGDGYPDIVVANRGDYPDPVDGKPGKGPKVSTPSFVCTNDGKGHFPACDALPTESATSIVATDLDGDGALDLFVPHRDGGQSVILWNDGKGHFPTSTKVGPALAWIRMGAAGDFDGDGWLDLAYIHEAKQATYVIYNRGRRQFGEPEQLPGPPRPPYALAVTDLNRDRRPDIVVGNVEMPGSVYYNTGPHSFKEVRWNDGKGTVYGFAFDDFNGDGWPDIVAARSDAPNAIWFSTEPMPGR